LEKEKIGGEELMKLVNEYTSTGRFAIDDSFIGFSDAFAPTPFPNAAGSAPVGYVSGTSFPITDSGPRPTTESAEYHFPTTESAGYVPASASQPMAKVLFPSPSTHSPGPATESAGCIPPTESAGCIPATESVSCMTANVGPDSLPASTESAGCIPTAESVSCITADVGPDSLPASFPGPATESASCITVDAGADLLTASFRGPPADYSAFPRQSSGTIPRTRTSGYKSLN